MAKFSRKRYLHIKRIITYMCYTSLIIGWQQFNYISSAGVMSMEFLNENNVLTTVPEEAVNLSLTPMKLSEKLAESSSSTSPLTIKSSDLKTGTSNAVDNSPITGWQCFCWNTTTGYEDELECRCKGLALVRVPQRLPENMQRLTISAAGIPMLRTTGLKRHASSLQDVMFTDLMEFESIQPGSFSELVCLRTIYISNAPKLMYLSANVFEGIASTLKSLRIINCSLKRIPDLSYLKSIRTILNMVDFEGNQIEEIYPKSVNIRTEQFILDNNDLTYIPDSAFYGSEIAKLSFKANKKLRKIHANGFAGIQNIMQLDLSDTSIEAMPHYGLEKLEVLRIQNTHTLKTIPSVYAFQNLRYAWLTHPFHCCAFKFPQRHDPYRHAQREKYLAELQKKCLNNELMVDTKVKHAENFALESSRQFNESFEVIDANNKTHNNKILNKRSTNDEDRNFYNHFEDGAVGSFSENSSLEYSISSSSDSSNPISDTSTNFLNNFDHFGEVWMDETADILPNNVKHAVCGKLTVKKIDVQCFPLPDALNPCEDVMGSQWLRTSVWIVVLLAVFGNMAVLLVLFSNWNEVTVPKFLISHLAFADLCLGLYLLLIASIDIHSMGEYFNFAYTWQYGIGCKVAGFLTVFATHLSVFTLTLITIERWYAITHAIYLDKRIKIKAASCIMVCGWVYSMVMSSLPLFGFSNYSSTSICMPMEARDSLDIAYLVAIMAVNGLAFCIIAICYARMYFSLDKETRHAVSHVSRGEMTVAKKMALLVFTNFACWAPIAFFGLTALAGLPLIDVAKSKILLVFFYPLNSCADPYLYAILTSQYRRDLFVLLSKYGLFKKTAAQYKMNYSIPTSHLTCPIPLLDQRRSSQPDSGTKITKDETNRNEEYV
ncbi:lutropin-choriogonadotropic hormone receptor-like isoform X2 [Contarinia nasturtii]|uniref:lutropin-choriogonadotropic hormone receptor-like isoform X2 n=1 Tax=Contarinia nasturtii TaxID=265458 RepID=UPI0012D3C107|nr:lutropin-choriogonadotropic hormone receptor-like isoform X2 [Contarinia nasturtii]